MLRTSVRALIFIAGFAIFWLGYDLAVWAQGENARASFFKRETWLDRVILHFAIGAVAGVGAWIGFVLFRDRPMSAWNPLASGVEAGLLYLLAITVFSTTNAWILVAILISGSALVAYIGTAFALREKHV